MDLVFAMHGTSCFFQSKTKLNGRDKTLFSPLIVIAAWYIVEWFANSVVDQDSSLWMNTLSKIY